jgi:hypothetical protein
MASPNDDMLTGEELNWMRRYEYHHRIRREMPPETHLRERRYQSQKLAEIRNELPRCPHAWGIIDAFQFRGLMGAEDVQEILHLLPEPPREPEPVKPKRRIRKLEMRPEPLAEVTMSKKPSRKLELFTEPSARPTQKPRRRVLALN